MKNTDNNFYYLGVPFTPVKRLAGKDADFFEISKHISSNSKLDAQLKDFNYDDFYKKAQKAGCKNFDLFDCGGHLVIPANNKVFEYKY